MVLFHHIAHTLLSNIKATQVVLLLCWCNAAVIAGVDSSRTAITATTVCGPSVGTIRMDGSAAGVVLAKKWAVSYQSVCPNENNTAIITIKSSSSANAAQLLCAAKKATAGGGSSSSLVDVAILSRPFRSNEAKPTKGDAYHFLCSRGVTSRTVLQAQVAMNAFVLVTSPKRDPSSCIKQLFKNGLTLQQLRALFSNYDPARIFGTFTLSPSTYPSISRAPTERPSNYPSAAPSVARPVDPTARKLPATAPKLTPKPTKKPTRRPTVKPSLPSPTKKTIYFCLFGRSRLSRQGASFPDNITSSPSIAPNDCSQLAAMVAGPPISSDLYQDFARTILPDYNNGERITACYNPFSNVDALIRFLDNNSNAIALISLPDYRANQGKLSVVKIIDSQGKNRFPSTSAIRNRQYPLGFNVYMAIVEDGPGSNNAQTKVSRSLLLFGYSTDVGDANVLRSGLVPLGNASKVVWINRLSHPTL